MIHFVLLISRQGKVRLTKWYSPYTQKERTKVLRELSGVILTRGPKLCNFVEWRGYKVVYKRYASLYFCMCIDQEDNELEVLEIIHHYVEILDRYFGSVCELDLIFNFHKAYYILDELLIAGELQESSKKSVARLISAQDSLVEMAKEQRSSISNIIAQATNRQGKVRLTKWYSPYTQKERTKVLRELSGVILTRGPKLCNFVEWRGYKVVYKRYASLYFCMCIDQEDNELEVLEIIHHYVEILDRYFGSVCELDLIFNFHKAYYILDELLIAGELQESSKKSVARLISAQDSLVEMAKEQRSSISNIIAQATK
nr:ap-1 complex subunit sigma-2 [Quercus suber]